MPPVRIKQAIVAVCHNSSQVFVETSHARTENLVKLRDYFVRLFHSLKLKLKECAIGKYPEFFVGIYRDIFGDSAKSITLHTSRGFRSNTTIAGMQTICFDIFPGFSAT